MNIHVKHDYSRHGFATKDAVVHHGPMNILALRRQRQLNQSQLAEMTKLSQSTISRAENGLDGVTLGDLKSIAAALGVELHELFIPDRPAAEAELLHAFRQLTPQRQQGWLDMAKLAATDHPES